MARIAFVQSYPYESSQTGDASYLHAIREHLKRRGHDVYWLVTDMARGRSLPFYRNFYPPPAGGKYAVRNGVRIGDHVVSFAIAGWVNLLRRCLRFRPAEPPRKAWTPREAAYVRGWMETHRIDRAILIFEACGFSAQVREVVPRMLALGVYLKARGQGAKQPFADALNAADLLADEMNWLRAAPAVGMHSMDDVLFLRHSGFAEVVHVGIGIAPPNRVPPREDGAPTVLFVGADALQNNISIQWFVAEVWPLIIRAVPAARLRIVGGAGVAVRADPDTNIDVVGRVPALDAEYAAAHVVVAPLISGTRGMKVAEALAHGCALVATPMGIDAGDTDWASDALILAEGADAFAAAVVRVLESADLRGALRRNALAAYEAHLSYDAALADMCRLLAL